MKFPPPLMCMSVAIDAGSVDLRCWSPATTAVTGSAVKELPALMTRSCSELNRLIVSKSDQSPTSAILATFSSWDLTSADPPPGRLVAVMGQSG